MMVEVILLDKKGDIVKLENFRPISFLVQLYKLFTRIGRNIEFYQSSEQTGFIVGFDFCDHLQTIRQMIKKSIE